MPTITSDESNFIFSKYEPPPEYVISREGNPAKLIEHLQQRQDPADICADSLLGWIAADRISNSQLESLIDIAVTNIARLAKSGQVYAGYGKLLADASGRISFKAREESATLPRIPE